MVPTHQRPVSLDQTDHQVVERIGATDEPTYFCRDCPKSGNSVSVFLFDDC